MWEVPESELKLLPDVAGVDAIELGCGTAYWSAWLARLGANPVGIDLSERQLETAAMLQAEHELQFPLIHASAENVPLSDESFDFAFSEYGAAIWCEPEAWLAEAYRLLRPGGRLIFLGNSPLVMLCTQETEVNEEEDCTAQELLRPQFGIHRLEWPDEEEVSFVLPHGEMIALLGRIGFKLESLTELQAPEGDDENRFFVPRSWARQWPCEDIWSVVKPSI
ncbi:MAG: methyltransferase domain-containing protein [Actinobacteria bacterium]|nr:methyltransferase domain-containing protein [Actinomycetota bacterium]